MAFKVFCIFCFNEIELVYSVDLWADTRLSHRRQCTTWSVCLYKNKRNISHDLCVYNDMNLYLTLILFRGRGEWCGYDATFIQSVRMMKLNRFSSLFQLNIFIECEFHSFYDRDGRAENEIRRFCGFVSVMDIDLIPIDSLNFILGRQEKLNHLYWKWRCVTGRSRIVIQIIVCGHLNPCLKFIPINCKCKCKHELSNSINVYFVKCWIYGQNIQQIDQTTQITHIFKLQMIVQFQLDWCNHAVVIKWNVFIKLNEKKMCVY